MTIKVISGQSLFDIAIEKHGSVLAAFEIAKANGLSVTTELQPGQELVIPESSYTNVDVVNYFSGKKQKIATALTVEQLNMLLPSGGINFMDIEGTNIVS